MWNKDINYFQMALKMCKSYFISGFLSENFFFYIVKFFALS